MIVALNFTKARFVLILGFLFGKALCILFLKCSLLSKAGIVSVRLCEDKPFREGLFGLGMFGLFGLRMFGLWTSGLHVLVRLVAVKSVKWLQ